MTGSDRNKPDPADVLDMRNYRIDRLPVRSKSTFERWMAVSGVPLAILAFVVFGFVYTPGWLLTLDPAQLPSTALENFERLGEEVFIRRNAFMLAIFLVGMILWTAGSIPNYLTSLIVIISLVLTGVLTEEHAYAQLGHRIMWLNIMSFILASMLVATGLAKRFTLWFLLRFGKSASSVFLSFIVINIVLSAFISATTAKAAILLPVFMVVAAIYGARQGDGKTNFGRNAVLQNLLNINLGAGAFLTGSGANLLAAALIGGAIAGDVFYSDWLLAMFPTMVGLMLIGYLLGMRIFFPLEEREKLPQIEGGMQRLREEYKALGPISFQEVKAAVIFLSILALWSTDRLHGISPTAVAFVGGIVALMPRIGIVTWNEVDIPWHLMLFSAGAYTLGAGFAQTGLPNIGVTAFFTTIGLDQDTPFWVLYVILTAVMAYSALVSQSKTMRAMIFVPIAIGTAEHFGHSVISLALPVAFLIEHVYVLPFNSKPAALLYETDHYSLTDAFRYGFTMMTLGWLAIIVGGETWFRWVGITPDGVFGIF
ncbi:MAG: anion permease [Gammaproteobacteria bacterium]|nr:anion permease [Gammaproteobacteria bacterium]